MKVLIVGAGIGGLSLGAFLNKCEVDFDIIEKSADLSRQGYSIGLWSNGRKMLEKLGLAERLDAQGERIKHFSVHNGKGELLKKYDLDDFYVRYGTGYVHIDRAELHDWLLEKAGADKVKLGTTITSLTQDVSKVHVEFSDGSNASYDYVVAADGVHSQIRKMVFEDKDFEHYIQWRVWYVWIDNKFKKRASVTQYVEAGQYISIFDDKEKTMCVLLAPVSHDVWDDVEGRKERLMHYFKSCSAVVPTILEGIEEIDIVPTDLASVKMRNWHNGRVVLLGDSAHAMEPFAGLGGSMAMEDAYILAGELLNNAENPLESYERLRNKRVNEVRTITGGMKWWSLVRSRLLRRIFNLVGRHLPLTLFTHEFHVLMSEDI